MQSQNKELEILRRHGSLGIQEMKIAAEDRDVPAGSLGIQEGGDWDAEDDLLLRSRRGEQQ